MAKTSVTSREPEPKQTFGSTTSCVCSNSSRLTHQKCSRPRPLLLKLVGLPGGLGEDTPLGDEDHMLSAELLL
jgi:hypothetical protein